MKPLRERVETNLYSGDNGRVFCGRLECAGQSAYFTGQTLAGWAVRRYYGQIPCESCGMAPPRRAPYGATGNRPIMAATHDDTATGGQAAAPDDEQTNDRSAGGV